MSTPTIARTPSLVPEWTIADRLRKAREHAGMEQTELAAASGLSRSGISNVESGRNVPHRSTLMLWALATGVSVEWLETGEAPSEEGASTESRLSESNRRPIHYVCDSTQQAYALAS